MRFTGLFIQGLAFFILFFHSEKSTAQYVLQIRRAQSNPTDNWLLVDDFFKKFKQPGISVTQAPDAEKAFHITAKDSTSAAEVANMLLEHLHDEAYLTASLDHRKRFSADSSSVDLFIGPRIQWLSLRTSANLSERWLAAAGYAPRKFTDKPLRHDEILTLQRNLLEIAENNGYPFATVWLDSLEVQTQGGISAVLSMWPSRYFKFSQPRIKGNIRLPRAYLSQYLGLKPGTAYSRERVLSIRSQLQGLLFLESEANPTVTFAGDEATVNLFLKKKRAGRFDFIIGLLPRPNDSDGRLLLTGSLNAAFQNALNLGERFSIEFERLKPETQKLDVQAAVPYLFGSPFGAEGHLNIFRRDSSWVDAQMDIGVQYLLPGADFIRFFVENRSSALQKIDTVALLRERQLPPNLDYRQTGLGLETVLNRLDYRFNPRHGWMLHLKGSAGLNTIRKNSQITALRQAADPGLDFNAQYDSLLARQQSARFRVELRADYFISVFKRSTIRLALRSGNIFSNDAILVNEQYRLGGNKLLRGFDEESLLATRYAVGTTEFRLLLGRNSYMSAFADVGYLENITAQKRIFLHPLGLGVGLNFETQAGIFGISVAVGRAQPGQSFDPRGAKFHLGYISLF
ncbi:MAG: BamA/TamA family outer membrane protein [Saprospiraceae bacterium]|nr:BamA/TamA family outer membrane protein [Saprospiraceae bacterium]